MTGFIALPVTRNSADAEQEALAKLQAAYPGWQPRDADLATILVRIMAVLSTDAAELASSAGEEIFRFYGRLAGIPPIEESPAIGKVTLTMIDDAGYDVPAGVQVSGRNPSGATVGFVTIAPLTVANGSTTIVGDVEATEPGAAGNGVTGDGDFEEYLDFLSAVAFVGTTSEGTDAEDDTDYLDRLEEELELQSPTPIRAVEFATLARRIDGVARAVAFDNYYPGVNEVQQFTVSGTGGSWAATYSGQVAGSIPWNATAADLQARLEALSNLNAGDVKATGGPLGTAPVRVEFVGQLAATAQPQITGNFASITGGAATGTATTITDGVVADPDTDRSVTLSLQGTDGLPVDAGTKQDVIDYLQGTREVNFEVFVIDPTYTTIDVAFTFTALEGYDPAAVKALAEQSVADYLSPVTWGGNPDGGKFWGNEPKVRYLKVAKVLEDVMGLRYVDSLTIGVHPSAAAAADVSLSGPVPLPLPGDIVGTPS